MPLDAPTCSYVVPAGVDADALVGVLAERVDLVADQPVTVEATAYDTVDRRLRDAGLEVTLEGGRGSARLVLHDDSGGPPVVAPLEAPAERWLAADLPAGPLHDRLGPVLEERALLPLVRLELVTRAVRVRNRDEKTVVRLSVTTPAALFSPDPAEAFTGGPRVAPDGGVALATRVTVAGVLGYPRPLAKVDELLGRELSLRAADGPVADEAIAALGGDPSGLVSTKVRTALAAGQRSDEAAVAVLTALAAITEANVPGTLADLDTEFLHDLRVSVRKARSVLRELKRAFPPEPLATQRDTLKWVQTITGEARDLDVQLLDWASLAARVPPDRRRALEPVHALVAEHRARAIERLHTELQGPRYREAWASYRAFLAGAVPADGEAPDAARPIAKTAGRRIRRVYGRMVEMGTAIDDDSPAEDLHELRKRGKELRYLLELFGGLWPTGVVKPMVKTLKGLQDVLGTHQDRATQVASLRALGPELAARPDGPEALLALGTLVDRLEHEQRQARSHFAERFGPFAAKGQRKLVDTTFRGMP
jgi:CHAD domain-containing protein